MRSKVENNMLLPSSMYFLICYIWLFAAVINRVEDQPLKNAMINYKDIHACELQQLVERMSTLQRLQYIATIESVGASIRIEGSKLSNGEIERILFGCNTHIFAFQDESLPKLANTIVQLVEERGRITISDIISITGAPRSTVKKQLSTLVDQKYLARHGQGRSVWYTRVKRI